MLWLLSKAQDIKSKQFPALTWEGAADGQALEPLRAYVIAQAEAAQDRYLRKRVWKRRGGLITRLLAMTTTAVGGAIPVVVQMYGENGKPWFSRPGRPGSESPSNTPSHKMSAAVKLDSTLPATCFKSQRSGSRLLPSVQPSMMLKARNKFQSLMLRSNMANRSGLQEPLVSTCRHKANSSSWY